MKTTYVVIGKNNQGKETTKTFFDKEKANKYFDVVNNLKDKRLVSSRFGYVK